MEWSEAGGLRVFRESPNPNGNLLDREGRLLTCRHGARDIVRRIPLGAKYPDQNHDVLMAHEYDFLNFSRMQLRRINFSLRFADGT